MRRLWIWGFVFIVSAHGASIENTCGRIKQIYEETFVPDHVNPKQLILGAGEGTTGTRWLAKHLSKVCGYTIAHWNKIYGGDWSENLRLTEKYKKIQEKYKQTRADLLSLSPRRRSEFDYDLFQDFDGILDTPVAQYFLYIFRTYPNSKVILTTRNATDWVRSRSMNHIGDPRPFAMVDSSILGILNSKAGLRRLKVNPKIMLENALLFELHNIMVRCIVPPKQLLEINVFEEDDGDIIRRVRGFLRSIKPKGQY